MSKWILGLLGASLLGCTADDGGAIAPADSAARTLRDTGTAQAQPVQERAVVDGCRACHRDELSLAGRNAETLAAMIADMAAERVAHVSPMPELSGEERVALAKALASGM